MADQMWKRAEADLSLGFCCTPPECLVWEHSSRVSHLCESIAAIPELAGAAIDRRALTAAALYHDAGWVLQLRAGEAIPRDLLLRPTCELQRELAAGWIAERLSDLLPPASLENAARAIRQCNDRGTRCVEAQILAEAESLEEIGPQSIVLMLRRQMADGKTLAAMVHTWQRQEEYHYWQARIKDGFRFEPVRRLADRRLQALRRFMNDLATVVHMDDLDLLAPAALPVGALTPAPVFQSGNAVA